ncbi:MAG: caspase family protein [Pseudomonadota bacterium]
MSSTVSRAAVLAAAIGLTATQASAATYALVIGIDAYEHIAPLRGAVNDARDIAETLRGLPADEVRLLLDGDATRAAITQNWRELAQRAGPGDTLIITYAGHGSNEPEAQSGSESDGLDENFLLAGFSPIGAAAAERIRDDEVAELIALSPEATVIFVADSCHSGSSTRSLQTDWGFRNWPTGSFVDDPLPPPPAGSTTDEAAVDNTIVFAAVPDAEMAPEFPIGGQMRGALSYSFAEGLRGAADADGDGVVTKGELEQHVRSFVRQVSNGLQHPQVAPAGAVDTPLVEVDAQPAPAPNPFATAFDDLPPVPLEVVGTDDPGAFFDGFGGVVAATDKDRQKVVWDVGRGEVRSGHGDVILALPTADPASLTGNVQAVVDKMRAVHALEAGALAQPLELSFAGGDGTYRQSQPIDVRLAERRFDHLILSGLSSTGEIDFVFPLEAYGDPLSLPAGEGFELQLYADQPYGADHLLAIETEASLPALLEAFRRHAGGTDVRALWTVLHEQLRDTPHSFAVFAFYTAAAG